jgi:glycosyltransferase involved in cell wall biosynthesis
MSARDLRPNSDPLDDAAAVRCTVLLPVLRPPYFLPNSIKSVLSQTVREFELFVICDGAPPETVECAQEFARSDPRVKVFSFLKGKRHGEEHLHTVLANASGSFVAYLEDDDLWFPNHIAELERLFRSVDFGHTIHVRGHPDGRVESLPSDLSNQAFRQRFLDDLFNRFGYSFCGHRLDAYRRLPEGWKPAPAGIFNDLHMWRKFLRMSEFNFGTRMVITAVSLPSHLREHMSLEERAREMDQWLSRIADEEERATMVEAAWRSLVSAEIESEQEILKMKSLYREAKAALAQIESMHPGSLEKIGHAAEAEANAQLELDRLKDLYGLAQHGLTLLMAEREAQDAAIAAYKAELAKVGGALAK